MSEPGERPPAIRLWILTYLGVVAVHLLVGANGYYPTVHPDEVIYRETARYFAGVGPQPNLRGTFVFPVGYPLLLAPLFRLFDGDHALGFALLLFNSLLASAVCFPVIAFLRRVLGASRQAAALAAAAVGVYPAYLVIVGMALTQHAFVPLYAALVALAWSLYQRQTVASAALLGCGAVALYAVHERALLVMAVAVAQVALLAVIGHLRKHLALIVIAIAAGGFFAVRRVMAHVLEVLYGGGGVERPLSAVLEKFFDVPGWVDFFLQVAGQAWYLLVATYGLFGIAVAVLVERAWAWRSGIWHSGPETAKVHAVLFLLATAGAIFTTCAIYFPENPIMPASSEFYFFGRINEGFLALFLATGLAALWPQGAEKGLKLRWAMPITLAAMCVFGGLMVWGRGMEALADDPRTYGVFGVRWFLRDNVWIVHPFVGTVLLAVVWGVLYRALRRRVLLLHGVVALAFLLIAADLSIHYLGRRQERQYRRTLPPLVAASGVDALAIDDSTVRTGRWAEMIRRVAVEYFDGRAAPPPSPVFIGDRRWQGGRRHGARFLAADRDVRHALWVMPGSEQERLYRPPDYRGVVFGTQPIWSVWEAGFSERELWRGASPTRWTMGEADLRVPLAGQPRPSLLHVDVAATAQSETTLEVEIDDRVLIEVEIPPQGWSHTLSLEGLEIGDDLRIELDSNRTRHDALLYGSPEPYRRGVLVRGLYLLDAEEAAAIAAPASSGSLRYRLAAVSGVEDLEATIDRPVILAFRVENAGRQAWLGRLGEDGAQVPRITARWHRAGGPPLGEIHLEVGRPVLPGRELRLAGAFVPRDAGGSPLPPGDYELRVGLEWSGGEAGEGETLILQVAVRKPRPPFFAPIRHLARHIRPSDPYFILTPF